MAKCFLGYSESYKHVMLRVKNLLEAFSFEVDVFDEPSAQSLETELEQRIQSSDCAVVLIGPHRRPSNDDMGRQVMLAPVAVAEAQRARSANKAVVIVLHEGVQAPVFFRDEVWPHFDFWDNEKTLDQYHHLAKVLLELKLGLELPETNATHQFQRGEIIHVISPPYMDIIKIHEVTARQVCGAFDHVIDTAGDGTPAAALGPITDYKVMQIKGEKKEIKIVVSDINDYLFNYVVTISPKLRERETITYRQSFRVRNRFPLTHSELLERISQIEDYPYPKIFGERFYGESFEVTDPMFSLKLAFQLPWEVIVLSYEVIVTNLAGEINEKLSKRARKYVSMIDDDKSGMKVIELSLERPEPGHCYYLLYEPGDPL